MSMTDSIADLLTRIRNAHVAKHDRLDVPSSKLKLEVCRVLLEEGYIGGVTQMEGPTPQGTIRITLRYDEHGVPVIRHLQKVSKPGRRVYKKADEVPMVLNGLGVGVISTSKGVLTDAQARAERVGGEFLCEVW